MKAIVLVVGATACLLGWAASPAEAAAVARPVIVALDASPVGGLPMRAVGARVVVTVRVRNASTCTFLSQRLPFSALYPLKTVGCVSGRASITVAAIANTYNAQVQLTYAVRVRGGGRTVQHTVTLSESGVQSQSPLTTPTPTTPLTPPPPPLPTASLTISSSTLSSTGGSIVLTYVATNASTCSLASSPALWTGSDPASVNCSGSYAATVSATTSQRQWTFTFTATNSSGQSASSTQMLTEQAPPPPSLNFQQSPNWSGYVIPSSGSLFTEASGQWTVPALNCSATPDSGMSAWVGIGGFSWSTGGSSGTLLQTGVEEICVVGVQHNLGWWEEYPSDPNHSATFIGFPVSTGDSIEASVFQGSNGSWETRVDDLTTGLSGVMVTGVGWGVLPDSASTFMIQGSTTGLSYSGGYSAEWIVEDFALNDSAVTLANFNPVTFTGLTTSQQVWSLTPNEGVEIVQNGVAISIPSAPAGGGFSVSYTGA